VGTRKTVSVAGRPMRTGPLSRARSRTAVEAELAAKRELKLSIFYAIDPTLTTIHVNFTVIPYRRFLRRPRSTRNVIAALTEYLLSEELGQAPIRARTRTCG